MERATCPEMRGSQRSKHVSDICKKAAAPLGLRLGSTRSRKPRWASLCSRPSPVSLTLLLIWAFLLLPWLPSPWTPHSHFRAFAPPGLPYPTLSLTARTTPDKISMCSPPAPDQPCSGLTLMSAPPGQGLGLLHLLLSPRAAPRTVTRVTGM